ARIPTRPTEAASLPGKWRRSEACGSGVCDPQSSSVPLWHPHEPEAIHPHEEQVILAGPPLREKPAGVVGRGSVGRGEAGGVRAVVADEEDVVTHRTEGSRVEVSHASGWIAKLSRCD